MSMFLGSCITKLTPVMEDIGPDLVIVLGDRSEMLAAALVGSYLGIPIIHIHGGEQTGTIDDTIRHTISRLASYHLCAAKDHAHFLMNLGEPQDRIKVVGSPGLDSIYSSDYGSKEQFLDKYQFGTKKTFLCVYHPVTESSEMSGVLMQNLLAVLAAEDVEGIIVYPNADAGGRKMIDTLNKFSDRFRIFENLSRPDYLTAMKHVDVMVGNSSSALIEAPALSTVAVNIGDRQIGRMQGDNIINCKTDKASIKIAVKEALTGNKVMSGISPYGDGKAEERITNIIMGLDLNAIKHKKLGFNNE